MTRRRAVVMMVAAALAASACTEGGGGGGGVAGGLPDDVLRIGLERPQSLDPAQARYIADFLVVDQLFDGLTGYDPATLQVRPAIAARWESTPDQKSWTFTLRPDARFSNGRQITGEDVKYTLDRVARKGFDSPAAPQLDAVVGFAAYNTDGRGDGLAGVTVPEPGKVKVDLQWPLSALPAVLGHPSFGIVPREAVEAVPPSPNFAEQPVGSGPFMFRSRSIDVLRLMPAPGANVSVRGMEVYLGRDATEPYSAFLKGQLDWTAVPADRVDEVVRDRGRAGFQPYPAQLLYGFNLKHTKFSDQRFREAIVRAIDRDAIVRVVYGNRVRATSSVVAQGVPGYQENACGERCHYNPERSKALVAEVFGSRPVPTVNIDFDDDPTQEAVAQSMANNLKAVGIPANLRPHPYAEYLKFASSGQQELFQLAWIGSYASPDAFLAPLFYSGKPDNVFAYNSGEFDALIRAARESGDPAKALVTYQAAEKFVLSQVPVVPIAQYETHTLVSSRVRDLTMSAFGTFDASQVRLAG